MSLDIRTIQLTNLPERLNQLHQPPDSLHTIGADLNQLIKGKQLGVVGSRKVSSYGRSITTDLVKQAALQNVTIISGLALGVDSIAHQVAIESGGTTVAVLPSGIKKIYPASHTGLARLIVLKGGTLISEYGDDSLPMRHQFIERNRIIASLSDALLVTEAAENSGSLHTARFALEMGKTVLAVPGNIDSSTSVGTNNLIKMGAIPVTKIEDIFDALGIENNPVVEPAEIFGDNDKETILLQIIGSGTVRGNEILEKSKIKVEDYQHHLTMLEIKGRIKPLGNDTWSIL